MKIALFLIAMCFTTMSFADECDDSNGKLEMSIGIYRFKTKELCKEVYNLARGCELENLNRAKKDNNNYKSIDCVQRILEFFELRKSEINRIGNNVFLEK